MSDLHYKLPDLGKNSDLFRTMHPDDLFKMRDEIQNHLIVIQETIQEALDKNITSCCDICAEYGYAYDDIPAGWGWLHQNLICDNCVKKWTERFGEEPQLNKEGELEYEDSSISEDTSHRGQAYFEFV